MTHAPDYDFEARDRLIEEHLHLAKAVAERLERLKPRLTAYVPLDDLVAFGRQGLVEAATRFDPSKQVSFTTFAWTRIHGAIFDGVRSLSWYTRSQYEARRVGDFSNLAAVVEITQSNDEYVDQRLLPEDESLDLSRLKRRIRAAVAELPTRERQIAERHYFSDENFTEIRTDLGLSSKYYVSRVHASALRLLRDSLAEDDVVAEARQAQ